jgi:hypothetical protein
VTEIVTLNAVLPHILLALFSDLILKLSGRQQDILESLGLIFS